MHVLHVVGSSEYGGGSKVILDLVEGSLEAGATVDVLASNERFCREITSSGAGLIDEGLIQRSLHPIKDLRDLFRLVRILRSRRFDVVHTHTSKAGVLGRIAAQIASVEVVVHTVHGFAFHDHSPRFLTFAVAVVERLMASFSSAVVTVSRHHFEIARELRIVPLSKLRVVRNGVAASSKVPEAEVESTRASLGLKGDETVVLCHGRLAKQKGIHLLLEAAKDLEKNGFRLKVLIAGDGPLKESLRTRTWELGLHDVVHLLGFRRDIDVLLEIADLVALPSLWEGLSISALESLERGSLLIASDIPSNSELVDDRMNGLLFRSGDAKDLSAKLRWALENRSHWDAMRVAAQQRIASDFSVRRMQVEYNQIYLRHYRKSKW